MNPPRFQDTTHAQRVVFGAGELDRLAAHLPGETRVLLITSRSYAANGVVARVRGILGAGRLDVFDGVRPHVPDTVVDAARAAAGGTGAATIVGLGGGSVLGTAKAVAVALRGRRAAQDGGPPALVAIPTTYAGSEMTDIYGITRAAEGRKETVRDPAALPALVVYDPALTLDLPAGLTAATGINALAHCIEGLYATTRSPLSTATALAGSAAIYDALPRCAADGRDATARAAMLAGAYLAGTTIAHATLGIHHGLCHVLGGSAGVPHGVANSIILPHALRFNLPACAMELASLARALDLDVAGLSAAAAGAAAIGAVETLIGRLGLPRRLRDVGVDAGDLPRLAALALGSAAVRANPRPVADAAQVAALLRAAW